MRLPRLDQQGRPPIDQLAPATIQRHLAALRGVLKECWRLGLMGIEDYHRAIDLPRVRGERAPAGRALTTGEIRALLNTCATDPRPIGRRDQAIIAVLYGGGLRRSEVSGLTLRDYDPQTGALIIRAGKGNKDRTTFLPAGARATLDVWLAIRAADLTPEQITGPIFGSFHKGTMTGRSLHADNLYEMIAQRCEQAQVDPCRPHDFRRTFIGDLLSAGVDIAIVQRLVGHADPGTTTRYDRRPDAAKAQAVEKLHVPFIRGEE
jgi:integrase